MTMKQLKNNQISLGRALLRRVSRCAGVNTVEPIFTDPLEGVTIKSDNTKPPIIGLNRVGRAGLMLDN